MGQIGKQLTVRDTLQAGHVPLLNAVSAAAKDRH
jgi:hypothetical protein